ncbi:hypothetical protein N7454_007406 [Penicillium verhagenii]|nr:hypothetical protein N7454_007406 [Penicillium verhagenii]
MKPSNSTLSKRRRFQPSITSYFSSGSTAPNASVSHNHYSAATFSATPVVPATVQSSLLSVGMRVRKSVADGYKTQIALEKEKAVSAKNASGAEIRSGTRHSELAPFSGMDKCARNLVTDDGDAFSLPASSQESVESSVSVPIALNGQKRNLERESDIFSDDDSDLEYNDSWREAPLDVQFFLQHWDSNVVALHYNKSLNRMAFPTWNWMISKRPAFFVDARKSTLIAAWTVPDLSFLACLPGISFFLNATG